MNRLVRRTMSTTTKRNPLRDFRLVPHPHPSTQNTPTLHATDLTVSEGFDANKILEETRPLLPRWTLCDNGKALEREFKFKTFNRTWDFMSQIATESKAQRHHPEWANVYNRTVVRWTTHDPVGLSGRDMYMARFCDGVAEGLGEVRGEE